MLGAVYGAFGIYNGTMTYGTFMAMLQLISQIQNPFANITGYLPKYFAMLASAERLMEIEHMPRMSCVIGMKAVLQVKFRQNIKHIWQIQLIMVQNIQEA